MTTTTATATFAPPPMNQRFRLSNGFDVSYAFYQFQCSLRHDVEFYMETHVHHLLAMSSIFLVKPGRMREDIVKFFGYANVELLEKQLVHDLGLGPRGDVFDNEEAGFIKNIIRDVSLEKVSRLASESKLLARALQFESGSSVQKAVSSIARL
ncbi:hypothetical protein BJV82DRAFT_621805 [Fennellomyces sp. T-0311]|nr:hypothetical protein BJV82DRAFT_621805 [Fennellomyces sp. T-0311]